MNIVIQTNSDHTTFEFLFEKIQWSTNGTGDLALKLSSFNSFLVHLEDQGFRIIRDDTIDEFIPVVFLWVVKK